MKREKWRQQQREQKISRDVTIRWFAVPERVLPGSRLRIVGVCSDASPEVLARFEEGKT